jgi:L-ribulose-5-phosphate 3-epimerase
MIGVENHGGLTATAEGLVRVLKAVSSDWVGALLDFGNYSKDPYAEFELTAPYTVMTHAKPTANFAGTRGWVDYRRVADIMRKAGYRGFLSIEYEEPGQDAMIEVPRFAAYLRGITG